MSSPVLWQTTFFRLWPISSEVTLTREFHPAYGLREVAALWSLDMPGWSSICIPQQVTRVLKQKSKLP